MIADTPATVRPTVWVVDDSPLDAAKARKALADWCSVHVFSDGSAALECFSTQRAPDVLVLDWVMPEISGIEVVRFLRSDKGRMDVPILLLTAQQDPGQIVEGLSAGANDYLAKPYAPEELSARARALVRSSTLLKRALTAEKTVRELLANSPDAFLAFDARGVVSFANHEAGRIFGLPAAELSGRNVGELLPTLSVANAPSSAERSFAPLPDVTIGERTFSPVVRVAAPAPEASTIISLRDVTETREKERRRLDFYSIIAHDLRSPLTAMLLRAELLMTGKRGPLSSEATDDVRKFSGNIRSMVALINDFLDLARLDDMSTGLDMVELDLAAIIGETVEELRPLADVGRLSLEWSPRSDLKVLGDKVRLGQVLSNLIGNAIKYTPAGGRIVVTASSADNFVETKVTDDGPGIPADAVPRLFERFTRVAATSRKMGTGLGLMIVREVVAAHGGEVGVHSELGKGSSFWFRLPRVDIRPPRSR